MRTFGYKDHNTIIFSIHFVSTKKPPYYQSLVELMEVDQFTTAEERADENEVLLEKELKQANQTLNDCINYFTECA